MTETMTVDRNRWEQFFDQLSKDHAGDLVTVELLDQDLGDQLEGERLPFTSASFDPRNDMVVISAAGTNDGEPMLRHMIQHPSEVDVATAQPDETVLRVVAPSNTTLTHLYSK
jgi:hypothetical protein